MKFTLPTALAGFVGIAAASHDKGTFAVLRFTGKQLTQGRMDPIVFPGKPSSHVHTVMGGSNFGLSSTGKDLTQSKCSNAMVKGDNSNYWFPSVYFRDPKEGTFEPVEIFYVNAYYFFEETNDDIKAFPLGLGIVSGNATTRVVPANPERANLDPSKGPINAARFTCPRLNGYDPPSWPAGSDGSMAGVGDTINLGEGTGFPDVSCDGYASPLRADIHFPSCYNPEAGLMNFAENMEWPTDNNGKLDCPKGFTHVPHLFFEVYWNALEFKGRWDEGKGEQPFVLSSGDVTGFSSHADFMAGWDEPLLQHIIDTCDTGTGGMDTCAGLTYGLNTEECTIESAVDETIDGVLSKLPGDNPLEGWSYGVDGSKPAVANSNLGSASSAAAAEVAPSESATSKAAAVSSTSVSDASATSVKVEAFGTTSIADAASTTSEAALSSSTFEATDGTSTEALIESTESKAPLPSSSSTSSSSHTRSKLSHATTATSDHKASRPTKPVDNVFGNAAGSSCKGKVHTVYETVTVTHTEAQLPAYTNAGEAAKRDNQRRHAHNHAHRHRSARR
ncbi:hypothetical protein G7046_g5296 [Stylonectria norvegica]|nr:hypothetical protein G7046_g5296 [Stylonectria norvegica]